MKISDGPAFSTSIYQDNHCVAASVSWEEFTDAEIVEIVISIV